MLPSVRANLSDVEAAAGVCEVLGTGEALELQAAASAFSPPFEPPRTPSSTGASALLSARSVGGAVRYSLPDHVKIGAASIHRYTAPSGAPTVITVFAPFPTPEFLGQLLDLNQKGQARLPDRFIIGDGGRTRAFMGIDQRPGAPLDRWLKGLIARIPRGESGYDHETVVEFLRTNLLELLAWPTGGQPSDGRAELPWDRAVHFDEAAFEAFTAAANDPIGAAPRPSEATHPVVPFERFLEAGKGYCIQRALLAVMILERLGFSAQVVNGTMLFDSGPPGGHTWVRLQDGRLLEPSWQIVQFPGARCAGPPEQYRLAESWVFENDSYPYLRDLPAAL
jgi:hypothetical protein